MGASHHATVIQSEAKDPCAKRIDRQVDLWSRGLSLLFNGDPLIQFVGTTS
jgi:hypothetical protein